MKCNINTRQRAKAIKKDYTGLRDLACQVAAFASSIALQRVYGYGADRQNSLAPTIEAIQNQYGADIIRYGAMVALDNLKARAADAGIKPVMPWPEEPDRPQPNSKGWAEYCEDCRQMEQGATIGWCYYALAVHEVFGFGAKRFNVLHEKVRGIIQNYTENAATCEYCTPEERRQRHANKDYAFKVLLDAASRLFKQDCRLIDDEDTEKVKEVADATTNRIAKGALEIMLKEEKARQEELKSRGVFDNVRLPDAALMKSTGAILRATLQSGCCKN